MDSSNRPTPFSERTDTEITVMLSTPAEHKRHVVYDAGHLSWPRGEFVRENLDWLDKYLGPVDNDPRGGASTP
jgi:hypothetical protein